MTTVVLAEKPSVARDIARVLGVRQKGEGCLTGAGYVVTWALGHLVEYSEPDEYGPPWNGRWFYLLRCLRSNARNAFYTACNGDRREVGAGLLPTSIRDTGWRPCPWIQSA